MKRKTLNLRMRGGVMAGVLGVCTLASAQTAPPPAGPTTTPGIAGVVTAGTPIVQVRDGNKGTEGPLGLPDGSLLYTETQGNLITRVAPNGTATTFLDDSNGSNGLGIAPNGDLVSVQVLKTQVGIVHPAAHAKVLADGFEGKPFGRPNDVVVAKDGTIYFTDSGVNRQAGQPAPTVETAPPAVYRITLKGELQRLDAGIQRPNGIQLSPDEKTLYVANTLGEHVLAYDLKADGSVSPRREFAKLAGFGPSDNGPTSGADGLAVDALGRLYVATRAGIEVFESTGQAVGTIPLPRQPQNLAFAGPGKRWLYAVGRGAVYRIGDTLTPGFLGRAK